MYHDVANGGDTGDSFIHYTLTWTSASDQILIELAGHLAMSGNPAVNPIAWGEGLGSSQIAGGPYHFKLFDLDGHSLGCQDNQIMGADILLAKGSITVVKNAVPDDPQDFSFTTDLGPDFILDDDGDATYSNTKVFHNVDAGSYYVTETVPLWWDLTSITFAGDGDSGSSSAGSTATIDLDPGEQITVTFTDAYADFNPEIDVIKTANATIVHYCDRVEYNVTVVNTGDCPLDVFLSDPLLGINWYGMLDPDQKHEEICVYHPQAGTTMNIASAVGTDPLGRTVSDQDVWTVVVSLVEKAALGGVVWEDLDRDGIQDAEEPGIPNVTVELYIVFSPGTFVDNTITDTGGFYSFINIDPGDYYLRFIAPTGYRFTLQDEGIDDTKDSDPNPSTGETIIIDLESGESNSTLDAGLYKVSAAVGGVWIQVNKFKLLGPWIGLASLIAIASISMVYIKHRKRQH